MNNRHAMSGILIFISFLITQYSYFIDPELFFYSGLSAWGALLLLFKDIRNKTLLYILMALTLIGLFACIINDFDVDINRFITINQYLLALLIGVGFLRLIATPKEEKIKALPKGEQSFLKTYAGIHLFGSVINLSSLLLVADRLYKSAPLSKLQIVLLTRAFSSDAYWSPFFVAFAAAITYAPQLNTFTIMSVGLVLALIAFVITYSDVKRNKDFNLQTFEGYPIHFETLYLPFLLALFVLLTHHYYAQIKIIILIALFSLLLTLVLLPFKHKKVIPVLAEYIIKDLPHMKNELGLFLVAGSFGVVVSSILMGLKVQLPFETFDGLAASMVLFVLIALSFIGIHPIISIAVIGNWMGELNHTLLAVTFLMSWSTAVSTSPFSGLNLTMQSRYDLKAIDLFKVNIGYAVKMYLVCVMILFALSLYLGL